MPRALVQSSLHSLHLRFNFSRTIPSSLASLSAGEATSYRPATGCELQFLSTSNRKSSKRTLINLQKGSLTAEMEMESSAPDSTTATSGDVVVQYVVLRRDLIDTWPLGSIVTQGCHAAVAAIWSNKEDPHTLRYCASNNLDSMHKVTLEVKGEAQIVNLSEKLKVSGIAHKLWIEQPENIPTCLATKPYPKSLVSPFFKKLKLCR